MDENTNPDHTNLDLNPMPELKHGHSFKPEKDKEKPKKKGKLKAFFARVSPKRFVAWFKGLSKKQKVLVIAVGVLILCGIIWLLLWIFGGRGNPVGISQFGDNEALDTVPSELTGLPVPPEVNSRQVTAVMVENSTDARPQSGLADAGLVFEAIAEGGITRFMLLFQDTTADSIGPIRSARPYYVGWLIPFDAAYAHVGGSPTALKKIKGQHIKDMDQFYAYDFYDRVDFRYAPHNVFTSTEKLNQLEKERGYTESNYTGFKRAAEENPLTKPKAKNISLHISQGSYDVKYQYNKDQNDYVRIMGGEYHKDRVSDKKIRSKVIIAMITDWNLASDGYHSEYKTIGSGKIVVFQNGDVIKGSWKRKKQKDQFTFTDNKKQQIELAPGKTWITVLSDQSQVEY